MIHGGVFRMHLPFIKVSTLFATLVIGVHSASAGSVNQLDAKLFARVRTGSGTVNSSQLTVFRQSDGTYSQSHAEAVSGGTSSATYNIDMGDQRASFRGDFRHSGTTAGSNWLLKSDGEIEFVLGAATRFSISGVYGSAVAVALQQSVGLYNVSDPDHVSEVFFQDHASDEAGSSLAVAGTSGSDGSSRGASSGLLEPGTYRFVYADVMQASAQGTTALLRARSLIPDDMRKEPDHVFRGPGVQDVSGSGFVQLNLNAQAVPLPPAVWSGIGVLGMFSVTVVAKRVRRASDVECLITDVVTQ